MASVLEDYKALLSFSASLTTILQFLTGIRLCQVFAQKGTTADTSGLPFVVGCLQCSVWLTYGILIKDSTIVTPNVFGTILMAIYTACFYRYTPHRDIHLKQIVVSSVAFILLLLYLSAPANSSSLYDRRIVCGFVAASLSVAFFASPLISLMHILRTKNADCLPYPMIVASFFLTGQWWLYGIIIDNYFVQIPNFLGWLLASFQWVLLCVFSPASVDRNNSLSGSKWKTTTVNIT